MRTRLLAARSGVTANDRVRLSPRPRLASSSAAAWLWKICCRSSGTPSLRITLGTTPDSSAADGPSSQVSSRSICTLGSFWTNRWSGAATVITS